MTPVFVDTSIWYAASDKDDSGHSDAQVLLSLPGTRKVTSDLVLAELWNLINQRAHHVAATRAVDRIVDGGVRLECATQADLAAALAIVADFSDQAFSLTDRVSWAIMERLAISDALAFDSDFLIYRYGPQRRRAFAVRP